MELLRRRSSSGLDLSRRKHSLGFASAYPTAASSSTAAAALSGDPRPPQMITPPPVSTPSPLAPAASATTAREGVPPGLLLTGGLAGDVDMYALHGDVRKLLEVMSCLNATLDRSLPYRGNYRGDDGTTKLDQQANPPRGAAPQGPPPSPSVHPSLDTRHEAPAPAPAMRGSGPVNQRRDLIRNAQPTPTGSSRASHRLAAVSSEPSPQEGVPRSTAEIFDFHLAGGRGLEEGRGREAHEQVPSKHPDFSEGVVDECKRAVLAASSRGTGSITPISSQPYTYAPRCTSPRQYMARLGSESAR